MLLLIGLIAGRAMANNIAVTNVGLYDIGKDGVALVGFDLSWENSWRLNNGGITNWDAAWVFVKYSNTVDSAWRHAYLSPKDSFHMAADNSIINVGTSSNGALGMGAFIYRDDCGSGAADFTNIKLCWDYSDTGLDLQAGSTQQISVHAIEMVYVPEGNFYVGAQGGFAGSLQASNAAVAELISTNGVVIKSTVNGYDDLQLYWYEGILVDGDDGIATNGYLAVDNPDFPTGYRAFYCMKYETSQGQYADFLNQLTSNDALYRVFTNSLNRHTIGGFHPNYSAGAPDRVSGYINIGDGMAYADWSGTRLMTELEFKKAASFPMATQGWEYAWGTNTIIPDMPSNATITVSGPEDGTETNMSDVSLGAAVAGGNVISNAFSADEDFGSVRCGLFATSNSTWITSGGSYWGIMELCGNQSEHAVTIGNETGRSYTGLHGDGELGVNGFANVSNWPSYTGLGAGIRGGNWQHANDHAYLASRNYAGIGVEHRDAAHGFRAVRSAPAQSGVGSGGGVSPTNTVRFLGGSYDGYHHYTTNSVVIALGHGSIMLIM